MHPMCSSSRARGSYSTLQQSLAVCARISTFFLAEVCCIDTVSDTHFIVKYISAPWPSYASNLDASNTIQINIVVFFGGCLKILHNVWQSVPDLYDV